MFDRRLLQELKAHPGLFMASILMAFLATGFLIFEYWWIAKAIHGVFLGGATWQDALPYLLYALLCLIGRLGAASLEGYMAEKMAVSIQADIRQRLATKVLRLGPVALSGQKAGSYLSLYFEGVESLESYFRDYLPQLMKALFIPLIFLVVVLPLDRMSGLIFLVTIPLIPFFMVLIGSWTTQASRRQWQLLSQLSGYLQDVIRGLETLISLGRSKGQGEKIAQVSDRYRHTVFHVQKWAFTSSLALELVATISIALVAVGLGLRLVEGDMVYQVALFILFLAPDYYQPMRNLGAYFHTGLDAQEAVDDIYAFLAMEDVLPAPSQAVPLTFERLEFRHVSYRYPNRQDWAVEDISFTLSKGQSFALAGQSGSGKSTVMLLALGFIRPTQGQILLNGQPLQGSLLAGWQEMVSYIPQAPHIFKASILDHITMGREGEEVRQKAVDAMARTGLQESLVADHLHSDTLLGGGGIDLSGGQEELLFLTRALTEDRPLLFLDEITDNMDLATEARSIALIEDLLQDRTALIIAHRLATIRHCDQVLVLHQGRLQAQDTYDRLKADQGLFQKLDLGGEPAYA